MLNKEFTELATQAKKTAAKDKAAYDKAVKDIVARQKDVTADIDAYDKAALEEFKTAKAKLTKDYRKLDPEVIFSLMEEFI